MKAIVGWLVFCVVLAAPAGNANAQQAAAGQSLALLQRELAPGDAVIWYLGMDGFAVKTAHHLLVFDPTDTGQENSFSLPESADSLSSGFVNPQTVSDLDVVVFTTAMGDEQYHTGIWPWHRYIKNITYVFGWDPVINQDNHEYIHMKPRDEISIGDIDVTAIQTTTTGSAFLVKADGITLLHGGNHIMTDASMAPAFRSGIDYLADRVQDIDLLFIDFQVGAGQRPPSITEGIIYADGKLSPHAIFPMGAVDATVPRYLRPSTRPTYEYLIDDLARDMPDDTSRSKIIRTGERGSAFLYHDGKIERLAHE